MMHNDSRTSATTSSTCNTRLQHGPNDENSVWGSCAPPRDRPMGGRAPVHKYTVFAVHKKKNARGSPTLIKKIMNAYVVGRWFRP